MIATPARIPGITPAMKSFTIDSPAIAPNRIMGIDSGMMIAMVADDDNTAAAKRAG